MAVTPTGIWSDALYQLRRLMSQCDALQTWVDADNATEALGSIYYYDTPVSTNVRPVAVVSDGDSAQWIANSTGTRTHYISSGGLHLFFEGDIADANQGNIADSLTAFKNDIGGIIDDMLNLSGTDDYMNITSISLIAGPQLSADDEAVGDNHYVNAAFSVEWGI
jgi:hypothetical protein